jgi:hypothetical protein
MRRSAFAAASGSGAGPTTVDAEPGAENLLLTIS